MSWCCAVCRPLRWFKSLYILTCATPIARLSNSSNLDLRDIGKLLKDSSNVTTVVVDYV